MSYREELIQVAAVAVCALQERDNGTTDLRTREAAEAQVNIFRAISAERIRQERKFGTRAHVDPRFWLTVLTKEVGEVARAILEKDGV